MVGSAGSVASVVAAIDGSTGTGSSAYAGAPPARLSTSAIDAVATTMPSRLAPRVYHGRLRPGSEQFGVIGIRSGTGSQADPVQSDRLPRGRQPPHRRYAARPVRCATAAATDLARTAPRDPDAQSRRPTTSDARAATEPSPTRAVIASISGERNRSAPGTAPTSAASATTAPVAGPGVSGARSARPARGRHDLDREHPGEPVDRTAELARRGPAHRHVVLLHRRRRDRVDGCRHREPLQLRHDARGRVLRDHEARVDADLVRQERRQALVAGAVEEAVGAPLARSRRHPPPRSRGSRARRRPARRGSCRSTRRGRRAVSTGLSTALASSRVGDGCRVLDRVAGGAVHLRGAAQRVRVLHAGALGTLVARDDGRVGEQPPQVRRGCRLPALRAQGVQVGGEHRVGAEQALDAHRGGDIGGGRAASAGRGSRGRACRACRRCR